MQDKVIGLVWRYDVNDYGIIINKFNDVDQCRLQDIYERYADNASGERGSKSLNLEECNVDYWEKDWAKADIEQKRKALAKKLWDIGFIKSDILYDNQADEQLTVVQIIDALSNTKDTTYLLETFLQFCDGSQDPEDHKMFCEAAMDIVHYMEMEV